MKRLPLKDSIFKLEFSAFSRSQIQMGLNGAFGIQNTGARLMNGDFAVAHVERSELLAQLLGRKQLMREMMLLSATAGPGDESASRRTDHQPAGFQEKLAIARILKVA